MQDLTQDQPTNQAAAAPVLPPELVELLLNADAVVTISASENEDGRLVMQTIVATGKFQPETIKAHAYVQGIYDEHSNILARMHGQPTDAMRYQAQREFALMASADNARFEVINGMVQEFEDSGALAPDAERKGEDFDKLADFLLAMVRETAPIIGAAAAPAEPLEAPKVQLLDARSNPLN